MRTADQIKRKLHELSLQRQALAGKMADEPDEAAKQALAAALERVEEQQLLLEWVLNEPVGAYHG